MTIVSDDDRPPYFRPALTKELLPASRRRPTCPSRTTSWYAERDVTLRLAVHARSASTTPRTVLATDAGPLAYDTLVLATGSSAGSLPVPGADAPRVMRIRHAADAERLLADGRRRR